MNKKIFLIAALLIGVFSVIPLGQAAPYNMGCGGAHSSEYTGATSGQYFGVEAASSTAGEVHLGYAFVYGSGNAKMVIYHYVNASYIVRVGISDVHALNSTEDWKTFTFTTPVTILAASHYYIGIVFDGSDGDFGTSASASGALSVQNDVDVGYASPALMFTYDSGGAYWQIYVTVQDAGATPTPTPAADGSTFWDTGLGAQIFGFIPTLASLIVVLLSSFLGWKFAGPWGFFAGINLGYIISVVFNLLPLWGFIALLVIDGLLLFGKVGFRT